MLSKDPDPQIGFATVVRMGILVETDDPYHWVLPPIFATLHNHVTYLLRCYS
jgi:hypothetical protein